MKLRFPNSASLHNITAFLRSIDPTNPNTFELETHAKWVHVHPVVLAIAACAAGTVEDNGGDFKGHIPDILSINYLTRMGLFDYVKLRPPRVIREHEEAGRFIPLTQIRTASELKNAIANLVPLLHAPAEVADPIKYVFSEMVRNSIEHASSKVGAFVAAQYYAESQRIAIGIADAGIGIFEHMRQFHTVENSKEAMALALRPGISGTTSRLGGTEFNAGAGLFFTKSIASLSKNNFVLYSGDAAYRLNRGKTKRLSQLHTDPLDDAHTFPGNLPYWQGTAVGIDINVTQGVAFSELLNQIRKAYYLDVKRKKDFIQKIKFHD